MEQQTKNMSSGLGFQKIETTIDDVWLIERNNFNDERGVLSKTFNSEIFGSLGLDAIFCESIYSVSKKNVLRGMHFQKYPHGHIKLVHVIEGEILDVVVGIGGKNNTRNRGKYFSHVLSGENRLSMFIPDGYAHGFLVLSEKAIVSYMTSCIYNKDNDITLHYDSFGFDWPCEKPIVSEKDQRAVRFNDFSF